MFAPVHKKGDLDVPANYRPINLLSVLRRIIPRALPVQVEKEYAPYRNQWGFRKGSNTETAVPYAVNNHRKTYEAIASLDLKQAHDVVPRHLLMGLIRNRFRKSFWHIYHRCWLLSEPELKVKEGNRQPRS